MKRFYRYKIYRKTDHKYIGTFYCEKREINRKIETYIGHYYLIIEKEV